MISLNNIIKIKLGLNIYNLIECSYTNELICNNITINLKTFKIKRNLDIFTPNEEFNCAICLYKEKYISYVNALCDSITVLNLENDEKEIVHSVYSYVEAVYTIDNETFCLCTQNIESFSRRRYSQHIKLDEN